MHNRLDFWLLAHSGFDFLFSAEVLQPFLPLVHLNKTGSELQILNDVLNKKKFNF